MIAKAENRKSKAEDVALAVPANSTNAPKTLDRNALEETLRKNGFEHVTLCDTGRKSGVDILLGDIPADTKQHQGIFDKTAEVLKTEGLTHQPPRLFPGGTLILVINDVHYAPTEPAKEE